MSTPQGPNPPHDQPADQPAWGQQPPGGWGQKQQDGQQEWDAEQTRVVRPSGPEQPQGGQPPGGPQQGGQQQGGQQQGGQPPPAWAQQGQYGPGGQPPQYGQQPPNDQGRHPQPGYGQQPAAGYPGQQQPWDQQQAWAQQGQGQQQAWGQNAPGGPQVTQQWPGGQPPGAQQWGQGFPPPNPAGAGPTSRSKLPWIIAGVLVVVLAAGGVLGFVTPGFFLTRVFDAAAVQDGVARVLTDDYGIEGVTAVTCGENIRVDSGATFQCDAMVDGSPVKVPVTVTDAEGAYEVGRPA